MSGQEILPCVSIRGLKPGGRLLTLQQLVTSLSAILLKAELDDSSHNKCSFHIGAARSAKEAGISYSQIQMVGRWKSEAY